MKTTQKLLMGVLATGALSLSAPAWAAIAYDQNVTPDVLFGTGNGNGSFTVDQNNGVELGLRAKINGQGVYNSNGAGTYTFNTGTQWNFEWSVNTDFAGTTGVKLDDLTYVLSIDPNPATGIPNYTINFDPINGINPNFGTVLWDHGIGNNSTANGAGDDDAGRTVASYATLIANNNVAQNSWRNYWYGIPTGVNGTYDINLEAYDSNKLKVAQTTITVNVVPEPTTMIAGALLLLPFGASVLRTLRKGRTA